MEDIIGGISTAAFINLYTYTFIDADRNTNTRARAHTYVRTYKHT